jgi:hypothetical protein
VGTLLFMRDALVTLKLAAGGTAVEYQGQVSQAAVEVTAGDTVTYPVLDGTIPTQIGPSAYALHLVAAQDWDTSGGLARFLWDNEGEDAVFVLQPHGQDVDPSDAEPAATGTVRLVAGSFGGEVGTYAELDVTLPCAVKPDLATAVIP